MLDYRALTFMKVCQTLNFTKAAQELHITQPAVSKHIQALETEYHLQLFTFSGKHCQLTGEGKRLFDMLVTMNNDIQHFKATVGQQRRPLNFGATLSIGEFVLTDSLVGLLSEQPQLQLKMLVDNTESLLNAIDQGLIDFALVEGFFSKEKYDFLPYKSEPFIAVTAPTSKLVKQTLTFQDLLDQPLIIREEGSGTRDILSLALKETNLAISDFHQVTEIGNLNTIKHLVKNNLGISFLYQSVVKEELANGELLPLQVKGMPLFHDFTFIWRKGSHFKEDYKDIFQFFIQKGT